jgi:hemin uptake protein HemP
MIKIQIANLQVNYDLSEINAVAQQQIVGGQKRSTSSIKLKYQLPNNNVFERNISSSTNLKGDNQVSINLNGMELSSFLEPKETTGNSSES